MWLVGILVPRLGIEPGPLAVRVWSPNHLTTREFPLFLDFKIVIQGMEVGCEST